MTDSPDRLGERKDNRSRRALAKLLLKKETLMSEEFPKPASLADAAEKVAGMKNVELKPANFSAATPVTIY